MSSIFNRDEFSKQFMELINEQIKSECESIIKEAVEKFEVSLRENLAKTIVSQIDMAYSCERMGNIMQIRVCLPDRK